MRRWILILVAGIVVFGILGFILTYVPKLRRAANEATCTNNLKELSRFTAAPGEIQPDLRPKLPKEIPAGTIVLPGVAPEERLSWFPAILPLLDQRRQDLAPLVAAINPAAPWAAERNQQAAATVLRVALCPAKPPDVGSGRPAPTCYVGIAGLGPDAATLKINLPAPAPPRAGCFRYDSPTPFEAIADGRSQSLLLGERSSDLGPWLRGGPATVRGLNDTPAAPPLLGAGGQFGGNHPTGSNWAFADWSVRYFSDRMEPKVLFGLATIAGRETDPLPGD
jgi:prepilin-type processing-associated H-X9-DG protein